MDHTHLLAAAERGDVALHEEATGNAGIGVVLERLTAHLDQGQHFDDVTLRIDHTETNQGTRTVLTYRGVKQRR